MYHMSKEVTGQQKNQSSSLLQELQDAVTQTADNWRSEV